MKSYDLTIFGRKLVVDSDFMADLAFLLFFAQDAIRVVIGKTLFFLPTEVVTWMMIGLMYSALILSVWLSGGERMSRIKDSLGLYLFMVVFFAVTYFLHPEYKWWYFESSYPIMHWIFKPNQFMYAYLFVRLIDKPERAIRMLKIAAALLLMYYTYLLLRAEIRGYWLTTTTGRGEEQAPYDLNYGYNHLYVFAVFFCCAFREKKFLYLIPSAVSLVEMLVGGSRGPLIGVAILALLTLIFYFKTFQKSIRVSIISLVSIGILLVLIFGVQGIFGFVARIMEALGLYSRTIAMIADGTVTSDNNRMWLYSIAVDMIREGFWGYGAYGDRQTIGQTFWVGYAHNLFLEILINFGWIIGGLLILWIVYICVRMIFFCRHHGWRDLFVMFFIPGTKLLLSGSFWFLDAFWACLGIYISYRIYLKKDGALITGEPELLDNEAE